MQFVVLHLMLNRVGVVPELSDLWGYSPCRSRLSYVGGRAGLGQLLLFGGAVALLADCFLVAL